MLFMWTKHQASIKLALGGKEECVFVEGGGEGVIRISLII